MSFRTGATRVLHEGDYRLVTRNICGSILLCIVAVAVPAWLAHAQWSAREVRYAMKEAAAIVEPVGDSLVGKADLVGKLVQVQAAKIEPDLIVDNDFNLAFPGALKVARKTEYCQWRESYTDEVIKYRDDQGNEREETIRRYYYLKGWEAQPIPSIFFDQPAAHHNPQRDPFPSTRHASRSAKFGDFTVHEDILNGAGPYSRRTGYSPEQIATEFGASVAANGEGGFRYIGGGYFLSRYDAQMAEQLLKMAGRFLEGSVDIQLGDFFSVCTAGDIRVSYDAVVPPPNKGATVIGKLLNERGDIGMYQTTRNYNLGLYSHDASTPFRAMLQREISSSQWTLFWARGATFLWALFLAFVALRRRVDDFSAPLGALRLAAATLGVAALAIGGVGFAILGDGASALTTAVGAALASVLTDDVFAEVKRVIAGDGPARAARPAPATEGRKKD